MAGMRSRPMRGGRCQGWYRACNGPGQPMRRKFFTGTHDKKETLRIAQRLEDESVQINLNYRPAPKSGDRHQQRRFAEVANEYLAWGNAKGGHGGRPWGHKHAIERKRFLRWWQSRLNLEHLADLNDALQRVDQVLRSLGRDGLSGKTLQQYADGLASFCRWCVDRGYLENDPLNKLGSYNTTPQTHRRSMTTGEIHRLLCVCPEHRRLLYEVAFCSGLRAGELCASLS